MSKAIFFPVISILLLSSCQTDNKNAKYQVVQKETETESVIQEFEGLETPVRTFQVSATSESVISLPNGGKLEFPANAFVDENGKAVQGEVTIEWKEYHTLTDIILSGIPMKYDSAGVRHNFESGGMFTIGAKQKGNKLEIAPNKKANIELASIQDTPCYNFYQIDEKTGKWDYLTTKTGTPMKTNEVKAIKSVKEEKPTLLDVQPSNVQSIKSLVGKNIVAWKTVQKLSAKDQNVLKSRNFNSQVIEGESPGEYILEVKGDKITKTFNVQPYFLEDALAESKTVLKEQEKDFSELLAYQDNVAKGVTLRSIEINGFGTYNWDIIHRMEDPTRIVATFEAPGVKKMKFVSMYLVCPEMNSQVRIEMSDWNTFTFDRKKKNCIIGILPDNTIVSIGNKAFDPVRGKEAFNKPHTFTFKNTGIQLKSGKDLTNQIASLIES